MGGVVPLSGVGAGFIIRNRQEPDVTVEKKCSTNYVCVRETDSWKQIVAEFLHYEDAQAFAEVLRRKREGLPPASKCLESIIEACEPLVKYFSRCPSLDGRLPGTVALLVQSETDPQGTVTVTVDDARKFLRVLQTKG